MRKRMVRQASGCVALVALAVGCGADSVNVGDRPDPIGGGDSPDAGGSSVDGNTRCNIPDLGQYRLLFDSDGGRLERRIYSMRADGTELEALTPPEELAREPALSPDGAQLAYVTPDGIVLRDMASGQSELLVPGGDQPTWSQDGTRLVYRKAAAGCFERMRMPDRVVDPEETICTAHDWSSFEVMPDGRIVYVVMTAFTGVDFGYQLGTEAVPWELVPRTTVEIANPTISPDSVWVAASYRCGGEEPSLWASPLSVATLACEGRRITPASKPSAMNADWGPSTLIAYERAAPPRDIAIIAADTGDECVIDGPGDDRNPSWGVFTTVIPE
jgi:hypothetical protein